MKTPETPSLVVEATYDPLTSVRVSAGARHAAAWKIQSKSGPFPIDTSLCDVWPGNTRDTNELGPDRLAELITSLASVGQQVPAIGRVNPADPARIEIIAGACRLTAIRIINETRSPDDQMKIIVDLRDLDNEAALKVVDAENRARSDMSMLEKARFYERAIESAYHTEKALAEALGLDKSTVNRTLAIIRLPSEVFGLIKNPHGISAAQASAFMVDWNTPELRDTLIDCIDELGAKRAASASTVFATLKKAVAPQVEEQRVPIVHDELELGSMCRTKGGVTVKLLPAADAVSLKPLVISVGNALKQLGFT